MKVIGVTGWSGSGKTTLMVSLLPELIGRGVRVSTMKHTHHNFEIDRPGKDSYRHREAGANEVLLGSSKRWVLLHEVRDEAETTIEDLIKRMTPVDLLLIEGFKSEKHAKIEVHRPAVGSPLLCHDDPTIVAVACDQALPDLALPLLDLNNVAGIADFIVGYCGIDAKVVNGAA
jgi:molybdopterin-guanine dinucleotide biosynthesis protein B